MAAGEPSAAAAPPILPEPCSGLFLEVSFRRLLASCESIVGGSSTARPDLHGTWRSSPVFHHYVETLQEQLADLQASAGTRLPAPVLKQYGAHVDALAGQLQRPDMPAVCAALAGAAAAPALGVLQAAAGSGQQQAGGAAGKPSAAGPGRGALPPPPRVSGLPPPVAVARTPQLQAKSAAVPAAAAGEAPGVGPKNNEQETRPAGAAGSAAAGRGAGGGAQPPAQDGRLQTQQQLHEDLTDELAGLAAQLKSNTLAIEGRLKEREHLLDGTEAALDKSVQRTKAAKEQATVIHRRGRMNLCLTLLIILAVGMAFAGMYVFIKFTRLAGYRAAVPSPSPPPAPMPMPQPADAVLGPGGDAALNYEEHYEL